MTSLVEYDGAPNLDESYDEFSPQEIRQQLITQIKFVVRHCSYKQNLTELERCEDVAASILNIIDGNTYLPSFEIKTKVDKRNILFRQEEGLKIYPNDCIINENGLELMPLLFDED